MVRIYLYINYISSCFILYSKILPSDVNKHYIEVYIRNHSYFIFPNCAKKCLKFNKNTNLIFNIIKNYLPALS